MSCLPRTQESPVITLARRRRMSAYRFDFQLGADSASVARQRYPKRLSFRRKLDELFNTYSNDTTFSRLMGCLSLFSCNFSPSPLTPNIHIIAFGIVYQITFYCFPSALRNLSYLVSHLAFVLSFGRKIVTYIAYEHIAIPMFNSSFTPFSLLWRKHYMYMYYLINR